MGTIKRRETQPASPKFRKSLFSPDSVESDFVPLSDRNPARALLETAYRRD